MLMAGFINQRIGILNPKITRNATGEQIRTYEEVCRVWAAVKFDKSSRANNSGEIWLNEFVKITIRKNPYSNEHSRLKIKSRVYDIVSYNEDDSDGTITIVAGVVDEGNKNE